MEWYLWLIVGIYTFAVLTLIGHKESDIRYITLMKLTYYWLIGLIIIVMLPISMVSKSIKNMFKISSTLFLVFFLFLITDTLFGQQERYRFIGVESGIDFQDCELPEFEFIRGDISSYGAGNVANDLMWYFQKWYLGIKIEIRSNKNKFGLFRYCVKFQIYL